MRPGRGRTRQPPTSVEEKAERALRGRGAVEAPALIALIHEVNPSGRELPREVAQRRYALKSRLQSLLISRFGAEVRVEHLPDSAGVVGLRWGLQGRDACHAVADELDEDARSWVRLALDTGGAATAGPGLLAPPPAREPRRERRTAGRKEPRGPRGSAGPTELLSLGRQAQEQYDFDEARECFAQAFAQSEGGLEPARALLELLVGQLAAFAGALELEDGLSEEASAHPDVRCLLALAAAHLDQPDRALAWLDDLDDRRAADSLAVLARSALGAGDVERAGEWLARARTLDASHPEVVSLPDELARARAWLRRPAEDELERTAGSGDDARAAEQARDVLARWPDSATARRVLREAEARLRQADARALASEAEQALARGDFAAAAGLFRKAEAAGDASATAKAVEAERQRARQLAKLQVEQVCRELATGAREEGLSAYFELADSLRAAVRSRLALPELSWLEELRPHAGGHQARGAVLALSRAVAMAGAEPEAALELLASHERLLQKVRRACELAAAASTAAENRKRTEAERALAQVRAAVAAGQLALAHQLLTHVPWAALPPEARDEVERLVAESTSLDEDRRQVARFEEFAAAGAWTEALELVHERLASAAPTGRDAWEARRLQASRNVTLAMRVEVANGECEPTPELRQRARIWQGTPLLLHPSGERVYLLATAGRWLFIYELDIPDGCARRLVSCRVPERFGFSSAIAGEDTLSIAGERGAVLVLSLETWQVLRYWPGADVLADGEVIKASTLAPGGRFLWLTVSPPFSVRVFDLARGRLHRAFGPGTSHSFVPAQPEPKVLVTSSLGDARLLTLHGVTAGPLAPGLEIRRLAVHPAGAGWAGIAAGKVEEPLQLVEDVGGGAAWTRPVPFADSQSGSMYALAASREAGCCYVLYSREDKQPWKLRGFKGSHAGLEQLFDLEVPEASRLAQDILGRRVVCLVPVLGGFDAIPLAGEAPALPKADRTETDSEEETPELIPSCGLLREWPVVEDTARAISEEPREERRADLVMRALAEHEGEVSWLLAFIDRLLACGGLEPEAAFVRRLVEERYADHPAARFYWIETDMQARRQWAETAERLDGIRPEELGEDVRPHLYHLKGIALSHLGRHAEALVMFKDMHRSDGQARCRAGPWLRELSRNLDEQKNPRKGEDLLQTLVDHLRTWDELFAEGDGACACDVADDDLTWLLCERQCLARLAAAYLAIEVSEPRRRFRKRLALAVFLEFMSLNPNPSGPLAATGWDAGRLAQVADQARQWLDGDGSETR